MLKKKKTQISLGLTTSWLHHRAPSPHFPQHPHTHSLMSPSQFGFFACSSLKATALPGSHTPRFGPTSPIFSLFSSDQPPRSKNSLCLLPPLPSLCSHLILLCKILEAQSTLSFYTLWDITCLISSSILVDLTSLEFFIYIYFQKETRSTFPTLNSPVSQQNDQEPLNCFSLGP